MTHPLDGTNETKDYFERLTLELRKACPNLKKPVLMVPVGHVMSELNQRMKAGQVPGYKELKDVERDLADLEAFKVPPAPVLARGADDLGLGTACGLRS